MHLDNTLFKYSCVCSPVLHGGGVGVRSVGSVCLCLEMYTVKRVLLSF